MIYTAWYNLHYHGITPAIFVWMLLAVIGLSVTVYNWLDAKRDIAAVEDSGRTDLMPIARASLRREALRLMSICSIFPIGLVAFMSKPRLTDSIRVHYHIGYWTPTTVAVTFTITMMVGLIVVTALADARERRRHRG